jgi:hypothetical protein
MARRRRRAHPNPTPATWLLIGGGVAAVGVVGYLIYKANSRTPAPTTPTQLVAGNVETVTLAQGTMADVSLSLANADAVSLVAPTGATLGNVTFGTQGVLVVPASGAQFEYVAAATGSTSLTATWQDVTGTAMESNFNVTVS